MIFAVSMTYRAGDHPLEALPITYLSLLEALGVTPALIPNHVADPAGVAESLGVQGLLLTGGGDIAPEVYHQPNNGSESIVPDRDAAESALLRYAVARRLPVIGICRGFQMLNVALGGSLYQDIASQRPDSLQHRSLNKPVWNDHPVRIQQGSLLHRVLGRSECRVNTSHHQAVKQPASSLTPVAWAPDGVIEGLESPDHPFVLGVQWHPEAMGEDPTAVALINQFVQACKKP